MRRVRNQTGLPDDLMINESYGEPSFYQGFGIGSSRASGKSALAPNPLGMPSVVPASILQNKMTSYGINADTLAKQLVGYSPLRTYLLIENVGTVDVFISFGVQPQSNGVGALKVPANTGISFDSGICPNNDVWCISTTTCAITVVEGVRSDVL